MNLIVEREGQTYCFDVTMGVETLTAKLRAYYDGPAPDAERFPGSLDASREVPAQWWGRGRRDATMAYEEIPRPEWLRAAFDEEMQKATFLRL